jgi:YHS domain-containing protein
MRKVLLGMLVLAAVLPLVSGCGQETAGQGETVYAEEFEDGAENYLDLQQSCPVCGGNPIKQKLHAELEGKRVYFDGKECVKKFKKNPSRFKRKLDRQLEDYLGG